MWCHATGLDSFWQNHRLLPEEQPCNGGKGSHYQQANPCSKVHMLVLEYNAWPSLE